jgi:NitT/TauT family transport system substrate-binding protein
VALLGVWSALAVACAAGGAGPAPGSGAPAAELAAASAAAASSGVAPAGAPAPAHVSIGSSAPSLSYLPVFLAEALGYYREEGLAVEFVRIGGTAITPALLSGELDFSTLMGPAGANAAQSGPSRIVQVYAVRLQHVLSVRPTITAVQQLAGKRVAVQSLGTLTAFEARKVAEHFGLGDVTLLSVGGDLERIAALEAGAADAAPLPVPANLLAERSGLPTLLRIGDVLDTPNAGLATTEGYLRDQVDLATRTLRAVARAIPAIAGQRERVIQEMAVWLALSPEDAARAYEQVVDTYSPDGLPTDAQMAAYLDLLRETAGVGADVAVAQVADFTIARRVASELGWPSP